MPPALWTWPSSGRDFLRDSTVRLEPSPTNSKSKPDPSENCHLNVKKLTFFSKKNYKNCLFFFNKIANDNFVEKMTIFVNFLEKNVNFLEKMSSFWQFFDIQMAVFQRVRPPVAVIKFVHWRKWFYSYLIIIVILQTISCFTFSTTEEVR